MIEAIGANNGELPEPSASSDRHTEVDAHFQVATFSVGAALTAAALIVVTMAWAHAVNLQTALPWLSFMGAAGAVHIGTSEIYRRRPKPIPHWRPWAWATAAITLVEALGWGLAPFAIPSAGDTEAMFLVMLTTLFVAAGSVIGYGRYLPTRVIAFVAPTAPYLLYSVWSDDRIVRGSFFLILLFLIALGRLGLTADQGFRREAAMRKRNALLAESWLRQKEAAERANLAKSKFLAAASHDLRQPIHALGLYVGAMQNAKLAPEIRTIAGKMEASIEVMERLFAAILDISRLDARAVEVRMETFALDGLAAAVCEEFREEATRKGLALRCDAGGLYVRADRMLLERILRNLVANAVRYTDRGEVRVRSRRRGGRVALQVWDTGRGVAKSHMPLIFEEYYQVGNSERDREKGLGLGLAIVRRLADLLEAGVTARSRLGRGSCFEVRLAPGEAADAAASADPARRLAAGAGGLVVVVDDDAAVRDAMRSALAGWGYSVVAAETGRDALKAVRARAAAPALLVCDYRLREDEDGLGVIALFRERFGATLPVVLVTGDTAPERLAEAHASGTHLLHKPVTYGKLRAAVAHLVYERELSARAVPERAAASS